MKWRERLYLPHHRPVPPAPRRSPAQRKWRLRVKRVLIGRPLARDEEEDQLLPKRFALPLFASDPLSSVAYATEEIMLVLVLAGTAALSVMLPIAAAISLLVIVVVTSYRQTVRAYPEGGGAYLVTRDNLGDLPARIAASSLLADYVLTVAVSVTAGVAAITSAWPSLVGKRVLLAGGLIVLLALMNLRGVRETSRVFALPTYAFFITVIAMIGTGIARCVGGCPQAPSAGLQIAPEMSALTAFLVLRAFASGSTALTGIEAIADGVAAFKKPSARNAATTLAIMAAMSLSMFVGITALARAFGVRVTETTVDEFGSVISQVGRTAFGGVGIPFYVLQVATVGVLVLAANTAFQDFPRLSAILAGDRLMPRQMRNRGDRLVFSNGVVILSALAIGLVIAFDANLTRLIQLYVVGVFTSFTLSQTGMIRHWRKVRGKGWRRSAAINAVGAATTGVVLVVVAWVKFARGAWIVMVAVALLVLLTSRIRAHYDFVGLQLRESPPPLDEPPLRVVVAVSKTWPATNRAIRFAELLRPVDMHFVHVKEGPDDEFQLDWEALYPDYPLTVIAPRRRRIVRPLRSHLRDLVKAHPGERLTVVVPELARRGLLRHLVGQRKAFLIKTGLLFEQDIAVVDLVYVTSDLRDEDAPLLEMPNRNVVVVGVGNLSAPARSAIAYAKAMNPDALHLVHVEIDPHRTEQLVEEARSAGLHLEILPSPYRSLAEPLVGYIRKLRDDGPPGTIVTTVIPEFVTPGFGGKVLHNQSAFALKSALLLEPDVAVASIPWHLQSEAEYGEVSEHRGISVDVGAG